LAEGKLVLLYQDRFNPIIHPKQQPFYYTSIAAIVSATELGGEMVQWPKYFYPLILMKIGGWIEYD
jgi:hypothetical protein